MSTDLESSLFFLFFLKVFFSFSSFFQVGRDEQEINRALIASNP